MEIPAYLSVLQAVGNRNGLQTNSAQWKSNYVLALVDVHVGVQYVHPKIGLVDKCGRVENYDETSSEYVDFFFRIAVNAELQTI